MIVDTLAQADTYGHLGPRFAAAFACLRGLHADTPDGRIDVQGDAVYVLVQSYETKPWQEKAFEAHRRYADVQVPLAGAEEFLYAPLSQLTPSGEYDAVRDVQFFGPHPGAAVLRATPGVFAVFLPTDGHMPGCAVTAPATHVKKAVAKVLL